MKYHLKLNRGDEMKNIDIKDFIEKPINLWLNKWLLLTAGDQENYNSMTIAWGGIGGMWNKPFIQVVVRPCRYTYGFMEKYSTFTVCSFPEKYREALKLLGTKSGRDSNKMTECGLSIQNSTVVEAPLFKEADLVLECKKIYWQDMDNNNFLDSNIEKSYPKKDYHRIYYGEILNIQVSE